MLLIQSFFLSPRIFYMQIQSLGYKNILLLLLLLLDIVNIFLFYYFYWGYKNLNAKLKLRWKVSCLVQL